MTLPLYLIMPPQAGLLAGFASGLLSMRRYLGLHRPDQWVDVLDMSAIDESDIPTALALNNRNSDSPILFGITTTTATYQSALAVARAAKVYYGKRAVILLGGPHASADARSILDRQAGLVDYVAIGEGERIITAFLDSWPEVSRVPGLAYRHRGRIEINPPPPPLTEAELDTITLDKEWFERTGHPGKFDAFTYVSARGCPLSCAFCSVSNQAIRAKSPAVLAHEIAMIVQKGYRRIAIEDNFFAHSPRRTSEVCAALAELSSALPSFEWDCQTRVEAIARQGTASMLASAGCTAVYLGVEALTLDALRFLGKAASAERYIDLLFERALPALFDAGLGTHINIQFGLPAEAGIYLDETVSRLVEIGRLADARGTRVTIFPQLFVVYPGTAHCSRYQAQGTLWPEIFEDFTKWELHESELVYWMGRYFAHGVGGVPLGLLEREAMLQHQFRINSRPLLDIERRLDGLSRCPGLDVFSYAHHLAPTAQRPSLLKGTIQ